MGDAASGHSAGAGQRRGRANSAGSSVLTPPTGMPSLSDLDTSLPTQRTSSPAVPADAPPPPAQRTVIDPCVCGHGHAAHEHYRPGSDCGTCGRMGCAEFRPENGFFRQLWRRITASS
jgi:hypothetical protein